MPGEDKSDASSMSYIDSLFFDSLPKSAQPRLSGEKSDQPPLVFDDVVENGYIDQAYFLNQPTTSPAVEYVAEVREKLGINQHTGKGLDLPRSARRRPPPKLDSQRFRIPNDDFIQFHRLTEDEAADVLFRCIIVSWDNLIVVNKPPGISSHGGRGQQFSVDSLLPRLAHRLCRDANIDPETLQLTHRLDKQATGALLISRNQDTHLKLTEAFAHRWIKKNYLCITSGIPRENDGEINLPISERRIKDNYRMVASVPKKVFGKIDDPVLPISEPDAAPRIKSNASTQFRVLARRNDCALLDCTTKTGVKHQIRVHLATGLDTPILGDHKYSHFGHLAPQRLSSRSLEALGIRQSKVRYLGLHLHAHRIQFGGGPDASPGAARPPPDGFFCFLPREEARTVRHVIAPVPSFFLANLGRLGMKMPSLLRWSRFKLF